MAKIVDYKVVDGFDSLLQRQTLDTLQAKVQWEMREGFQPIGGVAISQTQDSKGSVHPTYLQALVRYEE